MLALKQGCKLYDVDLEYAIDNIRGVIEPLRGWKEIAECLDYHPDHCRKLERVNPSFAKLIHRFPTGRVYAFESQLREWRFQ